MTIQERKGRFRVDPANRTSGEVWQGDVVKCFSPDTTLLAIVVSADCDLLRDKGGGEIVCIPALSINAFLEQEVLWKVLAECAEYDCGQLRKVVIGRDPSFESVTDEALHEWLLNRTREQIKAELKNPHPDELAWLDLLRDRLRNFSEVLGSVTPTAIPQQEFKRLVQHGLQQSHGGSKVAASLKKAREVLTSRIEPNRADLFLLPEVPGEQDTLGFVLPFRRVMAIQRSRLVDSLSEAKRDPNAFVAIGACRPSLTHAIVQKFSLFFSRIGLANAFEVDQRALASIAIEDVIR